MCISYCLRKYRVVQRSASFSFKAQIVNVFSFVGRIVSVTTLRPGTPVWTQPRVRVPMQLPHRNRPWASAEACGLFKTLAAGSGPLRLKSEPAG